MAAACGVTVVKRFTYRGDASEEYSNTYWLTGTAPTTSATWRALFDAIVAKEKTLYPSSCAVIRGYAYNDDTGHKSGDTGAVASAVWSVDLTVTPETPVAGTHTMTGLELLPGDTAVWVRWKTSRLSSPGGKPIYLRKYFHPAVRATGGATDEPFATWKTTTAPAYAVGFTNGSLPDARTITAPGHTDTIVSTGVSSYLTTRTLKRRGKRPGA